MRWTVIENGKKVTKSIDSGMEHNPLPRTERGKRRRAKNHPNGIKKGQLGYNPNADPEPSKAEENKSA